MVPISVREISYRELCGLPPIPSGFVTDRVYRLEGSQEGSSMVWRLAERSLERPYRKVYDDGDIHDWLASYADQGSPDQFFFLVAQLSGEAYGLLTWRWVSWNRSIWLVDIRVKEAGRRSGVGTALLERLKDIARKKKARGISVETQINNYPAISFYRTHGFEVAGFNDHLYTNRDYEEQDVALFLFWESR
jgi:ribosomal protein S18 acetylase RimI-like enzyme